MKGNVPIRPQAQVPSTPSFRRAGLFRVGLLVCGMAVVLLAGCEQEEIHSYTARKDPNEQQTAGPDRVTMLAALFPQGDTAWSFKVMNSIDVVPDYKKDFASFINSIQLTGKEDEPLKWKAPEGWKYEKGNGLRFGTFRFGPAEHPL